MLTSTTRTQNGMKLKITVAVFIIICMLTSLYAFSRYVVRESETSLLFSFKYFAIPSLVILTPLCFIFYRSVILPGEVYINHGFKRTIKIIQSVILISLGLCFFVLVTLHAVRLITNEYLGYKTVFLKARVVRSYKTTHHGNESYYVILQDKLGKETKLAVEKLYKNGTVFNGSFKLGYWGILYRTK